MFTVILTVLIIASKSQVPFDPTSFLNNSIISQLLSTNTLNLTPESQSQALKQLTSAIEKQQAVTIQQTPQIISHPNGTTTVISPGSWSYSPGRSSFSNGSSTSGSVNETQAVDNKGADTLLNNASNSLLIICDQSSRVKPCGSGAVEVCGIKEDGTKVFFYSDCMACHDKSIVRYTLGQCK